MKWPDPTSSEHTAVLAKSENKDRIQVNALFYERRDVGPYFELVDATEKAPRPDNITSNGFTFYTLSELRTKLQNDGFADYTVDRLVYLFTPQPDITEATTIQSTPTVATIFTNGSKAFLNTGGLQPEVTYT